MNRNYLCYCGLYCANCPVKTKVEPAARVLFKEMGVLGFEEIVPFMPDGESFWRFLTAMAQEGACISCKEGSGNPGCAVRICAKERGVEACAFCEEYPCDTFSELSKGYPALEADNELLREKGVEQWLEMQDKRHEDGLSFDPYKD